MRMTLARPWLIGGVLCAIPVACGSETLSVGKDDATIPLRPDGHADDAVVAAPHEDAATGDPPAASDRTRKDAGARAVQTG